MLHITESATRKQKTLSKMLVLAGLALMAAVPAAFAQDTPSNIPAPTPQAATPAPVGPQVIHREKLAVNRYATYDNKWELYGGLSFMNGQAGQSLPKRYNMGGAEGMATYWLGNHLGLAADYRWEGGTTPILPNGARYGYNRVLVMQNIYAGGVQWRGPKNHYAAVDYHALFGASQGIFDHAMQNYPGIAGSPISATQVGLYPNSTTPWGAVGGSIDFNYSANLAIRLSPDLIFEHFGTETREFFSISGGVIYRFGKKR